MPCDRLYFGRFRWGGQLNVPAILCTILLFLIAYDLFIRKTKSKNIIIGIFALAGSIINTAAPGNYVRSGVIDDTGLHPIRTIHMWISHFRPLLYQEFQGGLLLIALVAVFILTCALCKNSSREFKYPGLVTLYAFLGIFITDFPVLLGYSTTASFYWPSRVAFVERFAMIVLLTFCVAYWGGWCAKKEVFSFKKEQYFIMALIGLAVFSKVDTTSLGSLRMLAHIANGDFAVISEAEIDMLEQIEAAGSGDVTVYYDVTTLEGRWSNLMRIGLTADSSNWINAAVASYYGVDSVTLVYIEGEQ